MKKILRYLICALMVVLLIVLYGIKLGKMGVSVTNIIGFVIIFFVVMAIALALLMFLTKGTRKKLNKELENGKEYKEKDENN